MAIAATPPSRWEQPAAALAEQIAGILGPGQAQLTIRNLSTIPDERFPADSEIAGAGFESARRVVSGAESANAIRVTLSESARERLWVAEVVEGNETQVAMVHVDAASSRLRLRQITSAWYLRKEHRSRELFNANRRNRSRIVRFSRCSNQGPA